MILGGFTLAEDGKIITNVANAAVYSDLTAEHVQYIWGQIVNSSHAEKIGMAIAGLNQAIGEAMCELGNIKAFEDANIDDTILDGMERVFNKPTIDPEVRKKLKHGGRKPKDGL